MLALLWVSVLASTSLVVKGPLPSGHRTTAPTLLTACATLSRADVGAAVGRGVSEGKADPSGTTCDFEASGGIVSVAVHRLAAGIDPGSEIASLRAALPQARVRSATSIGPDAVLVELPDAGAQLHVIRNREVYVMVSVLGFGGPADAGPAAERLVRVILNRI